MRPAGRRARFVIVGATTVALAALGGFGGWAALSTDASTASAAREGQLSEAYGKARFAVAKLELAVREDQLQPTNANHRRVTAAVTGLRATLPDIARNGDARDRTLVAQLHAQINATAAGLVPLMQASENFDIVTAKRINAQRVEPHLDRIEAKVNRGAAAHKAGLAAGLASAHRSQGIALGATLVMRSSGTSPAARRSQPSRG